MTRRRSIAVVGSGSAEPHVMELAHSLGRLIAENGFVLITGGRDAGVMKAANEGAKEVADSLTIGILPHAETEASPAVDVRIVTDMGEARNNVIVNSADAVIACGTADAGTVSEIALAIKARKPVIIMCTADQEVDLFRGLGGELVLTALSPAEALDLVQDLVPTQ